MGNNGRKKIWKEVKRKEGKKREIPVKFNINAEGGILWCWEL